MPKEDAAYNSALTDIARLIDIRWGQGNYLEMRMSQDEWVHQQLVTRLKALVADVMLASLRLQSPGG